MWVINGERLVEVDVLSLAPPTDLKDELLNSESAIAVSEPDGVGDSTAG